MSKYIVQWATNWADEMDISGFTILEEESWKDFKRDVGARLDSFTLYVGTNEELEYENGDELLAELSARKITEAEEKTIRRFFGVEGGFTQFMYAADYEDYEEDNDYVDEDED